MIDAISVRSHALAHIEQRQKGLEQVFSKEVSSFSDNHTHTRHELFQHAGPAKLIPMFPGMRVAKIQEATDCPDHVG
jgi:hypothetical protein